MVIGSTPTITFTYSLNWSETTECIISFRQQGAVLFEVVEVKENN